MTSAGIGFRENLYVAGGFHFSVSNSSDAYFEALYDAVVFSRVLMAEDSMSIPHCRVISHLSSKQFERLLGPFRMMGPYVYDKTGYRNK